MVGQRRGFFDDATRTWGPGTGPGYVSGAIICVVLDIVSRASFRQECIILEQQKSIDEQRARNEALLQSEVRHQVALRSRELGGALARGEMPTRSGALSPGDRFDARYTVIGELGAGGMGKVYTVERLTDSRRFALKVLTGSVSGAEAARFAREAEIGAGVHHANLVSIVDVGVSEHGAPFLVMDLIEGGSLEDRRTDFGRPEWALPILRQIAEGLAALHDAAVVHRDLKPANVLLSAGDGGKRRQRQSKPPPLHWADTVTGAWPGRRVPDADSPSGLARSASSSPRRNARTFSASTRSVSSETARHCMRVASNVQASGH